MNNMYTLNFEFNVKSKKNPCYQLQRNQSQPAHTENKCICFELQEMTAVILMSDEMSKRDHMERPDNEDI